MKNETHGLGTLDWFAQEVVNPPLPRSSHQIHISKRSTNTDLFTIDMGGWRMICPLYLLAQSNPKDPYLILKTQTISFGTLHLQVMSCERQLLLTQHSDPLRLTQPISTPYCLGYLQPLERVIGSRSHPVKIPP